MNYFKDRRLIIATKHKKEQVISPIVSQALGVHAFAPEDYDTDVFGTFTGERPRTTDPMTTLRNKCLRAMDIYQCDLGIASEGSFGPHPSIFFAHADEELLLFMDKKHGIEIMIRELSLKTNFNGSAIESEDQLMAFAEQVLFPSHALILRDEADSFQTVVKGIQDRKTLLSVYHEIRQRYGRVYAETDMRAMYNPTRMQVIKDAAERLVARINTPCPSCGIPGYGVSTVQSGLPCAQCGFPTKSTLSHIYTCQKCAHQEEQKYPHHKSVEDPMYCDYCNP